MFSRNEWIGNLSYMEANKGYMLNRKAGGETKFNYPSVSASLSAHTKASATKTNNPSYQSKFANNMTIVAGTTKGVQRGDQILAYVNGELRGTSDYVEVDENSAVQFIAISGDEHSKNVRFELLRENEVIAISNRVNFKSNTHIGTLEEPFMFEFDQKADIRIYPNPFVSRIQVAIPSSDGDEIILMLTDITGRLLMRTVERGNEVLTNVELDGNALGTGVYILQVSINGVQSTFKVEKVSK